MTRAQQHAQDETVRVLAHFAREAERFLAARGIDTDEPLCSCGLEMSRCRCELRQQARRRGPGRV